MLSEQELKELSGLVTPSVGLGGAFNGDRWDAFQAGLMSGIRGVAPFVVMAPKPVKQATPEGAPAPKPENKK